MQLYVGNLSYDTTDDSLTQLFAEFGEVASARIILDRDTGRSRGFGFVDMPNDSDGTKAIARLNGKEVDGRELKVNEAKQKSDQGGGRW